MPTLIGDSSCVIDLRKVDLPYTVVVPQSLSSEGNHGLDFACNITYVT